METVQLQCGSCYKMMAISVEHLGLKVHCPACQAIVQAPSRNTDPDLPAAHPANPNLSEGESIFAPEEETEDVFGAAPQRPLVELPPEPAKPSVPPDMTLGSTQTYRHAEAPPSRLVPDEANAKTVSLPATHEEFSASLPTAPHQAHEEDMAVQRPRFQEKKSMLVPTLLIFLIPYSIVATIGIILLLLNRKPAFDPLERLPDPVNKKGARQVQRWPHDAEIPPQLRTTLNTPITIGAIQVTPLEIKVNELGDLVLRLKMKNVSRDQAFAPMHDDYLRTVSALDSAKPYCFLQIGRGDQRLYGGYLDFNKPGSAPNYDGELHPGEENVVTITSLDKYRKDRVPLFVAAREPLLWRVQVRRGLVETQGTLVSATAVIGVELSTKDIHKKG